MLAAGAWSNPLTDWSERGGDGDGDSFIENIGGFSDEGSQHVGLNNLNYIWIDTGVAWEAETTYNLKVAVGNRGGQTGAENATVYALLSGTDNLGLATAADTAAVLTDPLLIASETYNVVGNVSAGSFGDPQVLSFNSGDTPPTGTIVILLGDNSPTGRSHFDNVRLDALGNLDAADTGTNPLSPDSDMDGRFDNQELTDATDPNDASSPASTVVGFGVNFVSGAGEGIPIPAIEIAGFPEFAMKNWNNTVTGTITGDVSLIDGDALKDSDGNDLSATAGTTLKWDADTIWQISNQYPGQGSTVGGDSKLFTGYIDSTNGIGLTIDLTDVPYPAYDVIVYVASDGNGRVGEISIQDAADVELGRYDFSTNAAKAPFGLSDYVVTESTDSSSPMAQVAIFRGVKAPDLKIVHTWVDGNSGVAGFQIVRSSLDASPRIENLLIDVANGFLDFDAANLASGRTYHVEAGETLEDFSPIAGSQFEASANTEEISLTVTISTVSKYFVRVVEGP